MISTLKSSVLDPILTPKIKVIAGQISQAELRAAGIGDGFDLDRRLNAAARIEIGPHDAPVNVLGGYRFPGAKKISLA